jgi:hypothetical protein
MPWRTVASQCNALSPPCGTVPHLAIGRVRDRLTVKNISSVLMAGRRARAWIISILSGVARAMSDSEGLKWGR